MAKKTRTRNVAEDRANQMVDDIADFAKYRSEILPVLRTAIQDGVTAEDIYKKFQAYAAARAVSIAALEVDSGKALAAIKDILDRSQGKAKENQTVTHRMEQLKDEQLDALLLSKLENATEVEAEIIDEDPVH